MGLLVDSGYCLVLFYIYCDFSDSSSNVIAARVQRKLLDFKLSDVEEDARKEIELFLIAIKMNPPKVSLRGYTVVNRELFTSVRTIYFLVDVNF